MGDIVTLLKIKHHVVDKVGGFLSSIEEEASEFIIFLELFFAFVKFIGLNVLEIGKPRNACDS